MEWWRLEALKLFRSRAREGEGVYSSLVCKAAGEGGFEKEPMDTEDTQPLRPDRVGHGRPSVPWMKDIFRLSARKPPTSSLRDVRRRQVNS